MCGLVDYMCTLPVLGTWSTWRRSTWRRTTCVTGCVWSPRRKTRTSCATSRSTTRRMRMKTQMIKLHAAPVISLYLRHWIKHCCCTECCLNCIVIVLILTVLCIISCILTVADYNCQSLIQLLLCEIVWLRSHLGKLTCYISQYNVHPSSG